MRAFVAVAVLWGASTTGAASPPENPVPQASAPQQSASANYRGNEQAPLFVNIKALPLPTEAELEDKATERHEKAESDRWLVRLTAALVLVTAALVAATIFLYLATRRLVEGAEDTAKKQLRAYVAADIGVPTCQDGTLRFASAPIMINTGVTPAKNLSYWITAAILPSDLPDDFKFPNKNEKRINDAALHPKQSFVVAAVVDEFVPEEEVKAVMEGGKRKLYCWGTITYHDIFDALWETEFCHSFTFYWAVDPDSVTRIKYRANYHRSHNKAT